MSWLNSRLEEEAGELAFRGEDVVGWQLQLIRGEHTPWPSAQLLEWPIRSLSIEGIFKALASFLATGS
jgi:hypothetical protein